jgi:hypothetical protein
MALEFADARWARRIGIPLGPLRGPANRAVRITGGVGLRPQPPATVFNPFGIGTTAYSYYGANNSLPGDWR